MSINISISDLDSTSPEGLRKIAGLFHAIAAYNATLLGDNLTPQDPQDAEEPQVVHEVIKTENGIEVDSEGLPWDSRINTSMRTKLQDGTWRFKRGVSDEMAAAVKRELKITMGAPLPAEDIPPPPFVANAEPPAPPQDNITEGTLWDGAAITASPIDKPLLFSELMQMIVAKFNTKELTKDDIQTAVELVGLPSLPMLASRPDLVRPVADSLGILA